MPKINRFSYVDPAPMPKIYLFLKPAGFNKNPTFNEPITGKVITSQYPINYNHERFPGLSLKEASH